MRNKLDLLIISGLFSNLFYSIAYPIVHTKCMQDISSNFMSLSQLISCLLAIIISQLWIKHSNKLYKTFGMSLVLECVSFGALLVLFLFGLVTPKIYYIVDCILSATITRNIINGGCRLKAIRYEGQDRELYDHKNTVMCNIASICGFLFSTLYTLPTNIAFILMFVGISVDNLFYYKVYIETNKNYK